MSSYRSKRLPTQRMVREFLDATDHLPAAAVGEIAGVGPIAIQRWRMSPPSQLRDDIRNRILRHLGLGAAPPAEGE
jgi:hypothetical protein